MGCFRRTGARRRSAPRSHGQPGTPTRSTGTAITATRHRRRSSCRPRATAGIPTEPSRRPDTATTATGTRATRVRPLRTQASPGPGRYAGSWTLARAGGSRAIRLPTATPGPATSRATGRATRRAGDTASPITPGRATLRPARSRWRTRRPPSRPRNTTARTATGSRGITTSRSATTTARSPTRRRTVTRRTATTRASTTSAARTRSRITTAAARRLGYDPDAYNGSDYSTPGIGGNGYDLAGIIGTSDFEAVGYDEPRLRPACLRRPQVRRGPRLRQLALPVRRHALRRARLRRDQARQPVAAGR